MKIRTGFVSNSSSSSFICVICGAFEVYHDLGAIECEHGHMMCQDHIDTSKITTNKYGSDILLEEHCPICQFEEPSYPDLMQYFLKTTMYTKEEVFTEIKKVNKRRKVLKPHEYVEYVLRQRVETVDEVLSKLKSSYETYTKFLGVPNAAWKEEEAS